MKKKRMPEHLSRILVKAAGLLLAALAVVDVFLGLGTFEFKLLSAGGVLSLSVDVLCLVLGVFLYAGMASMQGRSGWFLLLFFLNHLILSADAFMWIMNGDPTCVNQHGAMLAALYFCDMVSVPVFIILTRQVTSGEYSIWELMKVRTKLDLAERITTAVLLTAALAIWILNFRNGMIFFIDGQGYDRGGNHQTLFNMLVFLPKLFCLVRLFKAKIRFEKKLPLLLHIVLPMGFFILGFGWDKADISYALCFIALLVTFGQFFSEIGAQNEKMKTVLGTYISEDMVKHMLEQQDSQEGEKYTATVLVTDLRGFTSASEHLTTEDTVTILNHWLSEMSSVIHDLNGTVTEFLGDGFLVVFGAPTETNDHADRAVAAALRMQEKTEEASRWNREHGFPSIRMGIGISSGEILFGSFGTKRVARLMAIGTPVNRAFAAEEKTLGGQIFITSEAREMLCSEAEIAEVRQIGGMELYSVTSIGEPWNIRYTVEEPAMAELAEPARIRIRRLEGKSTELGEFYGILTAVSTRKAIIRSEKPLYPYEQIRFNMEEMPETVYARNGSESSGSDGTCLVDITVCPRTLELRIGRCNGDGVSC